MIFAFSILFIQDFNIVLVFISFYINSFRFYLVLVRDFFLVLVLVFVVIFVLVLVSFTKITVLMEQRDHDGQTSIADKERWQKKASG